MVISLLDNRGPSPARTEVILGKRMELCAGLNFKNNRVTARKRFKDVEWMEHLQWPAMVATLLSAWLVAAQNKKRRRWGFWAFLISNVLWIGWGWHDHAYALIVLQIGLAAMNIRGVATND